MNLPRSETLIASKAARLVMIASDKSPVDFSMRRAYGAEVGLLAARASYLAGFSCTAIVVGWALYAIPLFGTRVHSCNQTREDEATTFEHFAHCDPDSAIPCATA